MAITDLLLAQLKKTNPQGYQFISEVQRSGRNPTDILREMYQNGQINDSQLDAIQKQGRLFGLNIPNEQIASIKAKEVRVNRTNDPVNKPTPKSKFNGWF